MINMFKVGLVQSDVTRFNRALDRIAHKARTQEQILPFNASTDYKHLLIRNILTQKYAGSYAPYSERYAKWKAQTMMMGSHFWMLFGDLRESIATFKVPGGFFSGIPVGAFDSGGKSMFGTPDELKGKSKRISMYGRAMEYGIGQPARPLFGPTLNEYFLGGFSLRGLESLNKIRLGWR